MPAGRGCGPPIRGRHLLADTRQCYSPEGAAGKRTKPPKGQGTPTAETTAFGKERWNSAGFRANWWHDLIPSRTLPASHWVLTLKRLWEQRWWWSRAPLYNLVSANNGIQIRGWQLLTPTRTAVTLKGDDFAIAIGKPVRVWSNLSRHMGEALLTPSG